LPGRSERGGGARGQEIAAGEPERLAEQGADVAPAGRAQAVRGRRDAGQQRPECAEVGGDRRRRQAEGASGGAHGRAQVEEVAPVGVLGAGEGNEHVGEGGQGRVEERVARGRS
jgi:hypothetical protein